MVARQKRGTGARSGDLGPVPGRALELRTNLRSVPHSSATMRELFEPLEKGLRFACVMHGHELECFVLALQQRLKGRGSRRRLNDVVIRRGGHVARLLQEESMLKRIDSDGLRVKFNGVSGCTSRQFCRELEEVGEIHLRRQLECKAEHSMHIQEFAGVDHEALLGLHRYAHGSPRWLIGLLGRGVWRGLGFLVRLLRCCCRICCNKKTNRVIRDEDGHERFLDPDSESEAEGDEAACQGVRVGLMVDGEMRPLAPDGCNDMATQEETTLLDGDIEVSDVRPPGPGQLVRIPLCAHHRQVYQSAALKRPDLPQSF